MPIPVVQAFAANIGRIEAERQLRQINAVALGSGTVAKKDQRQAMAELEKAANRGRRRVVKPRSLGDLAAAGIPVTVVPKGGEE